ncbi:MAG: class I SAM-dependent methyltransferase [Alphaproteobacteria bacterium]|nr:class I SAM-dependent methyltransferase [Alphaproteobacteria bacterium]
MTGNDKASEAEYFSTRYIPGNEQNAIENIEKLFDEAPTTLTQKLTNFTNWVRHRDIARFIFKQQIFQEILPIPGSIIECGVLYGGGLTTWFHLSEIYEPANFSRRIIGFDTFEGFPSVSEEDVPTTGGDPHRYEKGHFDVSHWEQTLRDVVINLEETRRIPQVKRMELVKGDVSKTIGPFVEDDSSLIVSLLYLDMDLYEPTKVALEVCLPRMAKGSIIVFDEMACVDWPGESKAMLEMFDLNKYELVRSPIVPHIAYLRV